MEVVGVLGYCGEEIGFTDETNFMFASGHGLCIVDVATGPKDICWRSEYGVNKWAAHPLSQQLAIAPKQDVSKVTIISPESGNQNELSLENPTAGLIIAFAFSRDGQYLLGLSDYSDHRIIVWDIHEATVLVTAELPIKCKHIAVSPLNYSSSVAYGDEGMVMCQVNEVIDEYGIKFNQIPILLGPHGEQSISSFGVNVVQWLPQNSLLVAATSGYMMHHDLTTNMTKSITHLVGITPGNTTEFAIPMFVTLSTKNIIVGYSTGEVHWYPYEVHMKFGNEMSPLEPVQVLTLRCTDDPNSTTNIDSQLSAMVNDPNFEVIIAGSRSGNIYKFPVRVQEKVIVDEFDDEVNNDNDGIKRSGGDQDGNNVFATPLYAMRAGVSLDVKSMGMTVMVRSSTLVYEDGNEVVKTEDQSSEETVQVFLAGSYSGEVTVHEIKEFDNDINVTKYLSSESDPFAKNQNPAVKGIAHSTPSVPKLLGSFTPCEGLLLDSGSKAISALQVLSVGSYCGGRLVAVGTVDGWLEVWRLEAYKMEIERHSSQDLLDEINDEDHDTLGGQSAEAEIQLDCKVVFRRKFYNSSISLISSSDTQPLFCIASYFDKDMYILNASPASCFSEIKSLTLGSDENKPVSLFWNSELLWVGCANGFLFTFHPNIVTTVDMDDIEKSRTTDDEQKEHDENEDEEIAKEEMPKKVEDKPPLDTTAMKPKAIWESSVKSMGATAPLFGTGGGIVIVRHDANVLTVLDELPSIGELRQNGLIPPEGVAPLGEGEREEDVPLVDLPGDMTNSNTLFDMSNLCIANSAATQLIATGASDGSVFIWRAKRGEIALVNKYHVHCRAVISLCFTEDSSKVVSTAADGSIFVVSVDRTLNRPYKTTVLLLENDLQNTAESGAVSHSAQLWKEMQMELVAEELKESFRSEAVQCKSIVNNIAGRLQTLLKRNEEANELEKMELHEFVVDVKQQKAIEDANAKTVAMYREKYADKNARNELIAARLRETCWDPMETHSVSLSTVQQDQNSKMLSSFPIERVPESKLLEMQRVKNLRAMEILSQRASLSDASGGRIDRTPGGNWRTSWGASLHSSPVMISWLMNDGTHWATENAVERIIEAEKAAATAAEGKEKGDGKDDKKKKVKTDGPESHGDDDDENSQTSGEIVHSQTEIDVKNMFNLLYAPQTVRTPIQKRIQIILLKEVLRRVKANFNKHFDVLYHEKEDVVAAIKAKNARIQEIIGELELENEAPVIDPKWTNIEIRDSAINVDDSEIKSRPYETEAMRKERLRLEEERRRAAANEDDDGRQRALQDMMNGTLEVKRDVLAEASNMVRPEWMDELDPALMTDAQKKEIEEFDERYQALQEEKAAYRKSLELEMKRLRMEIQDSKKSFDEKVASMERIKMMVSREILAQELYISRLALSMVKREQAWNYLKSTEAEIEENRKLRHEISTKIERVAAAVENSKNILQAVQDEEKNMDRSFKRDLQTLSNMVFDQDTLKTFTNLFRMRTYHDSGRDDMSEAAISMAGRGSKGPMKRRLSLKRSFGASGANEKSTYSRHRGSKGSSGKEGMGLMQQAAQELKNQTATKAAARVSSKDPFYAQIMGREKELRLQENNIPQMSPLNIDMDCPEGFVVDPFVWSKLQELRLARIAKEIEGKRQHTAYTELKKKLDEITMQEDIIIAQSDELKRRREDILARLQELAEDLDIVVTLKQGQDEVQRGAVVTDYSNAKLIPSSIIKKYNVRINELGKEKINVLSRIKLFRRKMNLVDWEVKHLRLEAWHLEEYFTDSQLFRVTRDLQKIIKGGADNDQSRSRLEKIAIRKEFLKKNGDIKVAKLSAAIEQLRVQLEEREYENSKFSGKIDALKHDVTVREQVVNHSKKTSDRSGDARNSVRMQKVVARRKLVDTAQVQAEEIDYLKQELDKTRQKTFPSFVRATRNRLVYNPDERI